MSQEKPEQLFSTPAPPSPKLPTKHLCLVLNSISCLCCFLVVLLKDLQVADAGLQMDGPYSKVVHVSSCLK